MLNLLPWRVTLLNKQLKFFLLLSVGFTTLTSAAILCCHQVMASRYKVVVANNQILLNKLQQIKSCLVSIEKTVANEKDTQKHLVLLQRQLTLVKIIDALIATLPSNGCLTTMTFEHNDLYLDGILLSTDQRPLKFAISSIQKQIKLPPKVLSLRASSLQKLEYKILLSVPVSSL